MLRKEMTTHKILLEPDSRKLKTEDLEYNEPWQAMFEEVNRLNSAFCRTAVIDFHTEIT